MTIRTINKGFIRGYDGSFFRTIDKKILNKGSILAERRGEYQVVKKYEPDNFKLETSTVWSFPFRGEWATHNGSYRGNWSPYVPRNLILRYTREDDIVLDPFVGSGTTMIECKLLKRHGIGVDINQKSIDLTTMNTNFDYNNSYQPDLFCADARNIDFVGNESIDLICAHPPYANIIKYSVNLDGDISLYDIPKFLNEIAKVASECFRVLKRNKYCAILIGDTRKNGSIVPLGTKVMAKFFEAGFNLKDIVIKEQHNCKSSSFWEEKCLRYNFMMIAHEYLYIFSKK